MAPLEDRRALARSCSIAFLVVVILVRLMATQRLLHICHARQDERWVRGVLIPALGIQPHQCWTRREDDPGAPRLEELERAVLACRYTLLVASAAARVDTWVQFAAILAQHLGLEEGKPRLLLAVRDLAAGPGDQPELMPLRQRCLASLDCTTHERAATALAALAGQLSLAAAVESPPECPYPGLRIFGVGPAGTFFDRTDLFLGRDAEGNELVTRLRDHRRALLVGPSGCGKSSLVRARVLPALAGETLVVAHPGAELEAALDACDREPGLARLLYVDQFEEAFLERGDHGAQRSRLLARLNAFTRDPGVTILLGMRADFYGDLMRSPLWDAFKGHRVELAPLRGDGLRLAIAGPAAAVGVHVEADLVERLVREADMDRAAEALPLLQVALEQLWAHRAWRYLSLESYARLAVGEHRGLDVVLARHADAVIAALAEPTRALARRLLIDLVHLGEGRPDTRRRRLARELHRAGDDDDDLDRLIETLATRRLIAVGSREVADRGEPYVDLAHDALITGWPALARWIDERRGALVVQRRIEGWTTRGLLDEGDTAEATRWIESSEANVLGVSRALLALIEASAAEQTRRRREREDMIAQLTSEQRRTRASVAAATRVAKEIVFEADTKLKALAGASSVRETLLALSRALLDDLQALGELNDDDQRTAIFTKVGQAEFALERGRVVEAQALYQEAYALGRQLANAAPGNLEWQRTIFVACHRLGRIAATAGTLDEARGLLEKALAVATALTAAEPASTQFQRDLAEPLEALGDLAINAGNLVEARRCFERSRVIRKLLAERDPTNPVHQRDLATVCRRLGDVAIAAGNLKEARRWLKRDTEITGALAATDRTNAVWQHALWMSQTRLGGISVTEGKLTDARRWFDQGRAVLETLVAADPGNTTWQSDLATSYARLGEVAASAGKLTVARDWLTKALTARTSLVATAPLNAEWRRDLADSYDGLGDVAVTAGDLGEARRCFERSLELRTAVATTDPDNVDWQRDLTASFSRLGDVAVDEGDLRAARGWYERDLNLTERLAATDPANAGWQSDLALTYDNLGNVMVTTGELDHARTLFERSLAIREILVASDPDNTAWQERLSSSFNQLGALAWTAGRSREASGWFERDAEVAQRLAASDPTNADWQQGLSASYVNLGLAAQAAGNTEEARRYFERDLEIADSQATADPANRERQRALAISQGNMADLATTAGQLDEAMGWFERALAVFERLADADPTHAGWQQELATAYVSLGDVAVKAGRADDARGWFERALAITEAAVIADPANTDWQRNLEITYESLGEAAMAARDHAAATGWFGRGHEVARRLADQHPDDADWQRGLEVSYESLGEAAMAARDLATATGWFVRGHEVAERLADLDPANAEWRRDLLVSCERLGDVALAAGRAEEARPWFERALAIAEALSAADPTNARLQRDRLENHVKLAAAAASNPEMGASHRSRAVALYRLLHATRAFAGDVEFAKLEVALAVPAPGESSPA